MTTIKFIKSVGLGLILGLGLVFILNSCDVPEKKATNHTGTTITTGN